MLRILQTLLLIMLTVAPLYAAEGVVQVKSDYDVKETVIRLENTLHEKGMTIFAHIRHSDSAQAIGIALRNTELIIFGNPKIGSQLMLCQQTVALDLPQKALVWEDEDGTVRISYNDPSYLQSRHNIKGCDTALAKVGKALSGITQAAARRD